MSINEQGKMTVGIREADLCLSWPCTTSGTAFGPDRSPKRLAGTSIAYTSTGIYTLSIPMTFTKSLPSCIKAQAQADTITDWFDVCVVGEATQSAGTLTVVVQCHRNGTPTAPAAAAGTRINLTITGEDSGGK